MRILKESVFRSFFKILYTLLGIYFVNDSIYQELSHPKIFNR